jgi:amidohydrolase
LLSNEIHDLVSQQNDYLVALRRDLHAIPELAFEETETAARIVSELSAIGIPAQAEIGGTGVVAVLEGDKPGPTFMLRADIDALPVEELTGLPFASTNGNMHACGHDGHMTILIGAARVLAQMKAQIAGKIVLVFQPAEEITGGALAMLDDQLLNDYPADKFLSLHLWNQVPVGNVGVNRGTVFASADGIRITVKGRGGHGAMPHMAIDPVVAAAQIISAAQTIVSREVPPNEMGVLTFGQIHGGVAPNVIPDEVIIEGTVRGYIPETRETILAGAERVAKSVGSALNAEVTFERMYGAPPVINDRDTADWVAGIAGAVVGDDNVVEVDPVSVGDDVSEFINRVPGVYMLLGASKPGTENHHNAKFDFDEACLTTGTEIFVNSAIDYLK